ncbi:MAG: hypothetical protein CMO38_03590 [Verrucomicrobiaceae bacterium]|nr:hypothetical protein [Verrucomicrobiaceae bacterium]
MFGMLSQMRKTLIFLFLFLISEDLSFAEGSELNDQYREATLVLYNQNVADSRKLAAYYSKVRNIPFANLVGIKCPTTEIISRSDYDTLIMNPLRELFEINDWWEKVEGSGSADNTIVKNSKIKFVAIMYGMPLKIKSDPERKKVGASTTIKGHGSNDAASLDSEIACLSRNSIKISGAITNPYFRSPNAGGNPNFLLVSRIDGPDYDNAKRLIDDAIAVENSGLWGNALIDIANLAEEKGAAYKTGDKWLENCGNFYKRAGIPVIYDRFSSLIPGAYPLGENIILYFGWYSQNAQGPFADSKFRFKKGAIAAHIHSYSASTIRTTLKHWSGPLVARGACAVLGNVYEPFLQMTTYLDIFNARLLAGFTFAESAWIATPVLSWMQVMIGDPLYQPFKSNIKVTEGTDDGYKVFKLAVLKNQLDQVSDSLKDGSVMESKGLHLMADSDYDGAEKSFNEAFKNYDRSNDKLRIKIHMAHSKRGQGKRKEAIKILRELKSESKETPLADALDNLIKQF